MDKRVTGQIRLANSANLTALDTGKTGINVQESELELRIDLTLEIEITSCLRGLVGKSSGSTVVGYGVARTRPISFHYWAVLLRVCSDFQCDYDKR